MKKNRKAEIIINITNGNKILKTFKIDFIPLFDFISEIKLKIRGALK